MLDGGRKKESQCSLACACLLLLRTASKCCIALHLCVRKLAERERNLSSPNAICAPRTEAKPPLACRTTDDGSPILPSLSSLSHSNSTISAARSSIGSRKSTLTCLPSWTPPRRGKPPRRSQEIGAFSSPVAATAALPVSPTAWTTSSTSALLQTTRSPTTCAPTWRS